MSDRMLRAARKQLPPVDVAVIRDADRRRFDLIATLRTLGYDVPDAKAYARSPAKQKVRS
jgi:hypothetical protein